MLSTVDDSMKPFGNKSFRNHGTGNGSSRNKLAIKKRHSYPFFPIYFFPLFSISIFFYFYRVENRILPVVFFFDSYGMHQDIEWIFCTETLQTFIQQYYKGKSFMFSVLSSAQPVKLKGTKYMVEKI